jgi:hypothetical protein
MNKEVIEEILKKYSYHYESGYKEGYHNTENEVFHFEFNENAIWLRESCDAWFYMDLDSERCEKLSNLFKELSIMLGGKE